LLSTIGRIIAALAKRPNLALGMRFSRLTTCGIGAMSVTFVCAALAGLLGGWLLLHGMAIGVLGLAMALMSASLGRWEPLPMLGLFDSVALFQVSFLIGAAARVGLAAPASGLDAAPLKTDPSLVGEPVPVVADGR
jgi:hypothetical protein